MPEIAALVGPSTSISNIAIDPIHAGSPRSPQPFYGRAALGPESAFWEVVELIGSPGWIRTSDHSINSRMLYR
jgi:hypothetical protein